MKSFIVKIAFATIASLFLVLLANIVGNGLTTGEAMIIGMLMFIAAQLGTLDA